MRTMVERWRAYVARHPMRVALVGGFVATHVATNTGMWYHGIGLPDLNFNLLNGYLVFGNAANVFGTEGMQDQTILTLFGMVVHYAMGISFALIFAFGIHAMIPIANTLVGNFTKAIIWSLILATLSVTWWINLFTFHFGDVQVTAGLFMSNFGIEWVIAVYLWHLVYGLHLGAFFNPAPVADTDVEAELDPQPATAGM
ncbi:MAG TPA: hypothetical protein VMP67_11790 [Candidatus Limnocylindria bacterium]|nr:hypothetical protein [Candidatus Limnocylindria bacterium]